MDTTKVFQLPAGCKRLLGLPYCHDDGTEPVVVHAYEGGMGQTFYGFWVADETDTEYRVANDTDLAVLEAGTLAELNSIGRTLARKYAAQIERDAYLGRGLYRDSEREARAEWFERQESNWVHYATRRALSVTGVETARVTA